MESSMALKVNIRHFLKSVGSHLVGESGSGRSLNRNRKAVRKNIGTLSDSGMSFEKIVELGETNIQRIVIGQFIDGMI